MQLLHNWATITTKNMVISPNFLVFPQNFHVRKLGESTVFFAVHCFQFFNAEVHTFLITFYFVLFDWTAGLELGTRQSHQ